VQDPTTRQSQIGLDRTKNVLGKGIGAPA
jgi:hypothetical protein